MGRVQLGPTLPLADAERSSAARASRERRRPVQDAGDGRWPLLHGPCLLPRARQLRRAHAHLGRREPGAVLSRLAVRRQRRDSALLPRRSHLSQVVAVHVPRRRRRYTLRESRQGGARVDGRLGKVLLQVQSA